MRVDHRQRQERCDPTVGRSSHPAYRHRQQRLWPDWRHHAFLTEPAGPAVEVDKFHRHHHAVVDLAIRDLKQGAGLADVPSGDFHANSAWLQCAVRADNLIRWTTLLGAVGIDDRLIVARIIRAARLLAFRAGS